MIASWSSEHATFAGKRLPERLRGFFGRFQAEYIMRIAIAAVVAIVGSVSTITAERKQSAALTRTAVGTAARPCNSNPAGSKRKKGTTRNRNQKSGDESENYASTCLEVHSTALDVQEYLQAQGREEKWNLGNEHVAEDAWTFSRKLERDELLHFTKQDANAQPVNWKSGAAFVQVSTLNLDGGFVRVQISAWFEGYGQSVDRFAPPKDSWPLGSNFTLEGQLISILGKHFKNGS